MDSLKVSLEAMTELFNTRMNDFQKEIQKTNPATPSTSSLAADFLSFKKFIMSTLETMQKQFEFLGRELDRLEMRRRRKIILVHGVPEDRNEDVTGNIAAMITDRLKLPGFSKEHISRSHRLGRLSEKPRPVVVKFHDGLWRSKIWYAKTKLKGTGITLSEFLTKSRHSVFLEARQRFGVSKCWTRDGTIHIIAPDGSQHQVECLGELKAIPCVLPSGSPAQQSTGVVKASDDRFVTRTKRVKK